MKTAAALAAVILVATSAGAFAHSNSSRLNEQADWIEQGRRDGSITWREGLRLRREQAYIASEKARLGSDGALSRTDKRYLYRLQDQAEADIVRKETNGWRRPWWLPRFGW